MPNSDLSKLKTISIKDRKSKVDAAHCGLVGTPGATFAQWLACCPALLGMGELRKLVRRILYAKEMGRPVVFAIGGHVIKAGCSPYVIDLIERGVITHVAMNGAAAIHDVELGLFGHTSEDVEAGLEAGTFGMTEETAQFFVEALDNLLVDWLGASLGATFDVHPQCGPSILRTCYKRELDATVHVAMGCDTIHMHMLGREMEKLSGRLGRATMLDFQSICQLACGIAGGVWLNIGCATLLPEVFLKAVAVARNLGNSLEGLTTADMDMIQSYRPRTRLALKGVDNINLTGHHEIMVPLLHQAIVEELGEKG